jgi:DNA-binding transcriptional regulator YiaG
LDEKIFEREKMNKKNGTKELEEYLEAHASELVETDDDIEDFVNAAKKDNQERKARAAQLQSLRRDKLKLSQSELAKAVGANVRTLQGWETGRQAFPTSVEILMNLMRQVPQVKRMLMGASSQKGLRLPTTALRSWSKKKASHTSKKSV